MREYIKKYYKYLILIGAIIVLLLFLAIKNRTIRKQTERIVTIEQTNLAINSDRLDLQSQVIRLQIDYKSINTSNDSLKKVLAKYQLNLSNLKKKHALEIAELVKIPPDTVFLRLQALYPNYDSEPLKYPFSGFQVSQIYTGAITYNMLQTEYTLQGKSLESCLNLNTGYEKGIMNLNSQITGLQDNIGKADLQIKNYNKEVDILTKRVNRRAFWNKVLLGISIAAGGIAIIK